MTGALHRTTAERWIAESTGWVDDPMVCNKQPPAVKPTSFHSPLNWALHMEAPDVFVVITQVAWGLKKWPLLMTVTRWRRVNLVTPMRHIWVIWSAGLSRNLNVPGNTEHFLLCLDHSSLWVNICSCCWARAPPDSWALEECVNLNHMIRGIVALSPFKLKLGAAHKTQANFLHLQGLWAGHLQLWDFPP
jgi:hypothetical protein